MSIYITQQKKEQFEAKIVELEKDRQHWLNNAIKNIANPNYNSYMDSINQCKAEQAVSLLREILSEAIVLEVKNIIKDGECMICGDISDTKNGWICEDCRHSE